MGEGGTALDYTSVLVIKSQFYCISFATLQNRTTLDNLLFGEGQSEMMFARLGF